MATGPRNLIILAIFEYNRLLLADVLRDSDAIFYSLQALLCNFNPLKLVVFAQR